MIKILLAHPDEKVVSIYRPHLKQHFTVDSANDGLEALRKFKESKPLVVVSDYNLPLFSGIGLLKYIRNQNLLPSTPFIFLTSHTDNSEALGLGANDWIEITNSTPNLLIEKIYYNLKTRSE